MYVFWPSSFDFFWKFLKPFPLTNIIDVRMYNI